jgi:hypothetical protein
MRHGLKVESTDAAVNMLLKFLEEEQVALLLGSAPAIAEGPDATHRERAIVVEFVHDIIRDDPALSAVIRGILEGLVLYHAAFLPELGQSARRIKNLGVVFDSVLVRQALGYEGHAMQTLMRETIDILKAGGARCLVFDKTVHEIGRILSMYEDHLATAEGRKALRPVPMARHFLTQRYSPGDVREMRALLEIEIARSGFTIYKAPPRVKEYTAGEKELAARLADPIKKDELEPRVIHDVDCIAGILTLRKGHRSSVLDDAGAVFATSSTPVIRTARLWWEEDEGETGIEPVVHIRALSNLAWLKKPSLSTDFMMSELVALCTAAMRPSMATWQRFLHHLESEKQSQRLTSDEVIAIVVSAMSDKLLREAETDSDDPEDLDAVTLDEIVDRVKSSYDAKSLEELRVLTEQYESKFKELTGREQAATERASQIEHTAAENMRRRDLLIEGRSRRWAKLLSRAAEILVVGIVIAGALALIVGHQFHRGWIGVAIGIAIVVFVGLELIGILKHVSEWHARLDLRLTRLFREWLSGSAEGVVV